MLQLLVDIRFQVLFHSAPAVLFTFPSRYYALSGALPCSLAATWGISFDYFSSGYLDVSVHQVCPPAGCYDITHSGLPHSEIHGSRLTCSSPWLIAAYRVFHRLGTPRHPPYALCSLTYRSERSFRAWRCRLAAFVRRRSAATTPHKNRSAPSQPQNLARVNVLP